MICEQPPDSPEVQLFQSAYLAVTVNGCTSFTARYKLLDTKSSKRNIFPFCKEA